MAPSLSQCLPFLLLVLTTPSFAQGSSSISALVDTWKLNAGSFNFTVPGKALGSNDTSQWIKDNWKLNGKIDWGDDDITFSADPSTSSNISRRAQPSSTSSASPNSTTTASSPVSTDLGGQPPVLRIEYPEGSYSKKTGGTQFYAVPLDGQFERMLLSYDIWFPSGYDWRLGGKLPGLRGGPETHGCSGGNATDGTGCFSTRMMWRQGGAGEVYAYIPTTQKDFCKESEVTCNSDYGTSLARGSFTFVPGQWQTVQMLVVLNGDGVANGVVELYYNGVQAMSFANLELRKDNTSITSVGGMFFSTFFGGDDSGWATPVTTYTYYRNMQLYAGTGAADGTGDKISGASMAARGSLWMVGSALVVGWWCVFGV